MEINEYERFCESNGNFMQSSRWANVKANWQHEFITVNDENGAVIGSMLILIKKLPIINRTMFYAPRGPVCDMHNKDVLYEIFNQLCLLAKKHRAYTVKLDPLIDITDTTAVENLKALGFVHHPERLGYDTVQCRENYMMDIKDKKAEEVFEGFKSKWRYNIRLAQRKGVSCKIYREEALDDFVSLMQETSERDGFNMRGKEYFRTLLRSFPENSGLCMCYLGNTPLSGALYINYAGTMSYVYGCSSNQYRNYMPNYLMQWTMIKHSCKSGCKVYDFCGIPYWYDENHKNYGVYRFKQGFGGYVKTYAGEFDYNFSPITAFAAEKALRLRQLF